jgi:hypothetical protein
MDSHAVEPPSFIAGAVLDKAMSPGSVQVSISDGQLQIRARSFDPTQAIVLSFYNSESRPAVASSFAQEA